MFNCSLWKPSPKSDGRVVVVPTYKHASLERIAGWVRDGAGPGDTARLVAEVRAAVAAGDEDAKAAAKIMLWSFTPAGVVAPTSRRVKVGIVWQERTLLVAVDIDHADDAPGLRDKLAALPEVAAVWVSASGQGAKALIAVDDVGETAESYTRAWFAASCRLEMLGYPMEHRTKIDIPGLYWNGIQFFSHDAGAVYRPDVTPLRVHDWPEPPNKVVVPSKEWRPDYAPRGKPSAADVLQMLSHIRPADLHWMGGSADISVMSMADALHDWDASAGEGLFYDWLRQVGYDRHGGGYRAWLKATQGDYRVSFGSLVYWARDGGWQSERQESWRPERLPTMAESMRQHKVDLEDESWMH